MDDKDTLDRFFDQLKETEAHFMEWTGGRPLTLTIDPDIIRRLSRIEGFYQRPEVSEAQVTKHAPVIRYLKLNLGVVTIDEDYEEVFYHFE